MDNILKEKKTLKIQVRITPVEKRLLDKLMSANKELSISRMFRNAIMENCQKYNIKDTGSEGIGNFVVG